MWHVMILGLANESNCLFFAAADENCDAGNFDVVNAVSDSANGGILVTMMTAVVQCSFDCRDSGCSNSDDNVGSDGSSDDYGKY